MRRDDYEDGVFPLLCAYSGAPADGLVSHRVRRSAGPWIFLLVFLGPIGWVAMVVIDRVLLVEAHGVLPASSRALEARRAAKRQWNGVLALGLAGVAAGALVLAVASNLGGFGVVVVIGGVLVALLGYLGPAIGGVGGQPDRTGRTVTLTAVSPELAEAYRAQDHRRAARRRAELWATEPS